MRDLAVWQAIFDKARNGGMGERDRAAHAIGTLMEKASGSAEWRDLKEFAGFSAAHGASLVDFQVFVSAGAAHTLANVTNLHLKRRPEMNMNIVRWDPFRELSQLFDRDAFVGANANGNVHRWQPLVDIRETKDAYRVELELPAVDAKDVRIELKSGVLHVSGERRFANDEDGRVHRRERSYGKFTRSFRLPEDANPAAIDASAKDGVVSIAIGKVAEAQARTIEVEAA